MLRFILLSLLLTGCSTRVPFDTTDKVLLGLSTAALAVDWKQTSDIHEGQQVTSVTQDNSARGLSLKRGTYAYETNPILGDYPTHTEIGAYFITAALLNAGIAYVLPPNYRKIWLGSVFAVEVVVIRNNHLAGNVGLKTTW